MPPRRTKDGEGKSVELKVRIWYEEGDGHIRLDLSDGGEDLTSACNKPSQVKRYHPNLYAKLARILASEGAPHPDLTELDEEPEPRKKKKRFIDLGP